MNRPSLDMTEDFVRCKALHSIFDKAVLSAKNWEASEPTLYSYDHGSGWLEFFCTRIANGLEPSPVCSC